MTPRGDDYISAGVLRGEKRAVRRVLRLVDGYLSTRQQDELIAWNGGMMTWEELRAHVKAALKLL